MLACEGTGVYCFSVTVSQYTQPQKNSETETYKCQIVIHTCAFIAGVFQQALLSEFLNQIPMYVCLITPYLLRPVS